MRIGQTSFVHFLSKLLSSALGFVATLYFARVLGAEVLGFYALALTVSKWVKLVGDIGVASAVTKRISEGEEAAKYFTAGGLSLATFALVCVFLIVAVRGHLNSYVGADVWVFVVLIVCVGLFSSLVTAALKGNHLVHITGLLSPVRIGLRSVIQIGLVVASFGLVGMLAGYVLGGFLVTLVGLFFMPVRLKRPSRRHFTRLYNYAKYSWLGSLRGRSFNDVDIIVLGIFVSPALVGVYSVAWNLSNFIGIFGSSIRQSTFPELSRADAQEQRNRLANVVSDALVYSGLMAIPGFFGAMLLADRLLRIYGEEFTRGAAVLALLVLSMLIYDYQNQLLNALNAMNRPDLSFRVNAVFILLNLVMNVGLVYLFDIVGAAVATVLSAIVGLSLSFWYLRQLLTVEVPVDEFVRQLGAALVMAVVVGLVRYLVEAGNLVGHNVALVVALVGLGAATYFAVLYIISTRFRTTVRDNAPASISFLT
jgi:O-antigen/teichoic acid export membrane protein